jgi:hypothetical protein
LRVARERHASKAWRFIESAVLALAELRRTISELPPIAAVAAS